MASPSLTAVVTAFWPERFENVERIVRDLQRCHRPPDTLIVLNNNPAHPDHFDHLEGVRHIKGTNWECRGKYVAGLLAFADYYLLNDDDITVGQQTTQRLMVNAYPGCITANRGIIMHGGTFFDGEVCDADRIPKRVAVEGFCGSSLFTSHQALVRTLAAEMPLRQKWPTEGDDILAGLANRAEAVIMPMNGNAAWKDLSECGVAMNRGEDYYDMRDDFTRDALIHMQDLDRLQPEGDSKWLDMPVVKRRRSSRLSLWAKQSLRLASRH
jgi:hypothetical protein